MNIRIKTKDKKNILLKVNPTDKINEIKIKIQEKEGIPIYQQQIILDGERLGDEFSISNYDIQNNSNLLLVNEEKSLLYGSYKIFDNSNLIDRINQSRIYLINNVQEEDVINLLNEAISYLDENFDINTTLKLFQLIYKCFGKFPERSLDLLDKRLQKENISVNHIILSINIFKNSVLYIPKIRLDKYENFISSLFQQISEQIEKSPNDNLVIFGNEIPQYFKMNFIRNIVLLSKPTEHIVSKYYQYIFYKKTIGDILNHFIKKVCNAGLINLIPESVLFDKQYLTLISFENLEFLINSITEQTFRKYIAQIDEKIDGQFFLEDTLCRSLINKLIEFDIKIESTHILLNNIQNFKLDSKSLEYFYKYKIKLSEVQNIPKTPDSLRFYFHPEDLPEEFLSKSLNEANDLDTYEVALYSELILSPVFSKLKFWKHILSLVSTSEKAISDKLIQEFAFYFQENIEPYEVQRFYDSLIFDEYPPDEKQSEFLLRLIKSMDKRYFIWLINSKANKERNERLCKQKVLPCPSLCQLFYMNPAENKNSSLYLYAFEFSFNRANYDDEERFQFDLKIVPRNRNTNEIITQFIKQENDLSLIKNIDQKALSLISSSLVFTSEKFTKNVIGLTINSIIPFYAISFNHLKKSGGSLNKSPIKLNLLVEACKRLTDSRKSTLLNVSINSILSKIEYLFNKKYFSIETAIQITKILTDSLMNGTYLADKLSLIRVLFYLSCEKENKMMKEDIRLIAQKYKISLFNLIFKSRNEIVEDKRFNGYLLNLSIFDQNELRKSILAEYKKLQSDDEIIQLINFIINYFINLPCLKVDETKIHEIYEKLLNEEKSNDALISFVKFMNQNEMKLNYIKLTDKKISIDTSNFIFNDVNSLIFCILNHPKIEDNTDLFEKLFFFLMNDKSIAFHYALSSIEKLSTDMYISLTYIITTKYDAFINFKKQFASALNHSYALSIRDNLFVKRINVEKLNFPKTDFSFINMLINEQRYQSFVCLYYLASYFPFIFEPEDSQHILAVELTLPAFNCFSNSDDQIQLDDYKKAFAAYQFLISCLYSTKFIQCFIQWLFENIESLTNSQALFMVKILSSLYKTKEIQKVVIGYALKYDFLNQTDKLLSRKFSDTNVDDYYRQTIYHIFTDHMNYVEKNHDKTNNVLIDQIKNGSINNPFELLFNYCSVIPIDINISRNIELLETKFDSSSSSNNKTDSKFSSKLQKKQTFWLNYYQVISPSGKEQLIHEFYCSIYINEDNTFNNTPIPLYHNISFPIHVLQYYFSKPIWIYKYLEKNNLFPRLKEHEDILIETTKQLEQLYQEYSEKPFSANPYSNDQINYKAILKSIIKNTDSELLQNEEEFSYGIVHDIVNISTE